MSAERNFYDDPETCPACEGGPIDCKVALDSGTDDQGRKVEVESWTCRNCGHDFTALSPWEDE